MSVVKALGSRVLVSSPAVALSATLLLAAVLTIPRSPAYGQIPNMWCKPAGGVTCANCNVNGTVYGCTAPIPQQWTVGACNNNLGSNCTNWPQNQGNYDRGTLVKCLTGKVFGVCNTYAIRQ